MQRHSRGSRPLALIALAATLMLAAPGAAESPEDKGTRIAEEMDARDSGFGDSSARLEMILADQDGRRAVRRLRIDTLEIDQPGEGDRTLIVFDAPRDIAGTALLTHTRITAADDQWLYLPALRRVRRIASANKSGPFVGSEFTYEDLLAQDAAKYRHRWLRDEPCDEQSCFVVERVPVYEHSGYTKQVVWIDTEHYRPMKIEYFDRRAEHAKTLVLSDYRLYREKFWRAHDMLMVNHQTGKSTRLSFHDYAFGAGLADADFTAQRLERAR